MVVVVAAAVVVVVVVGVEIRHRFLKVCVVVVSCSGTHVRIPVVVLESGAAYVFASCSVRYNLYNLIHVTSTLYRYTVMCVI